MPGHTRSAAPLTSSETAQFTLQPGTYFGGIQITGNANVTFSPGTYILAGGGLTVTGNSALKGTGVTFYNTSATGYAYAPIDLTGNETANLSAPTSGTFEGFLFFQDPSVPVGSAGITVVGNSSSTFDGIVYFAHDRDHIRRQLQRLRLHDPDRITHLGHRQLLVYHRQQLFLARRRRTDKVERTL